MALADIIRKGVSIAHNVTKGAQATVTHEAWLSQAVDGERTYDDAVPLTCILDVTRKQKHLGDAGLVTIVATLTFLNPIPPNGGAGRDEPIDVRDRITLPDGRTGPILMAPSSVWDSGADRPYLNEIYIGEA